MAIAGAEHGTVIISDHQTAGRGRYSRDFFSPAGGLYMSVILRPEVLHFDSPTTVTAFAAVSVCEAIEAVSDKAPEIKWVNDIFVDGKKAGGILTEAITDFESGSLEWIVLGIGVNVCVRPEDFPDDLRSLATSICTGERTSGVRNRLAAGIINRILGFNEPPGEKEIFEKYRKRLMMLGKEMTVVQGQTTFKAAAVDIDPFGHLIVKKESGEVITLFSGEILM